jgi:TP901 family phage tail tape measure protein/lambda family phage tail tape measure protein
MVAENVQITFSQRGARRVTRDIAGIGAASAAAAKPVNALKGLLLSLGVGISLVAVVREIADFEQAMSTVRAVTMSTGQEFESLTAKARDLGATTRFSATEAADGMTFLARAGFDAREVLETIPGVLQLAQAGALGLASAADIASNVLKGMRLEVSQTQRVVDVLAKTSNSANTNVEQLGQALSFAAPAAAAIGVDVEEASATIGALSNAGVQATRAGTSLRQIFIRLLKPIGAAGAAIKDMGLSAADLDVQARGLVPVLETLRAQNISLSEASDLVGTRQAANLLILVDSIDEIKALTAANRDATGTAAEMARIMDDNLNGAVLAMRSAFAELVPAIGDAGGSSGLRAVVDATTTSLRFLADNLDKVADVALVLSLVLVRRLIPAVTSLTAVLLRNPIGLLAVAATTAISALTLLRDEIVLIEDGLVSLGDFVTAVFNIMDRFVSNIAREIESLLLPAFDAIGITSAQALQIFNDGINLTLRALRTFINAMVNLPTAIINAFIVIGQGMFNALKEAFDSMLRLGRAFREDLFNTLSGDFSFAGLRNTFLDSGVLDEVLNTATSVVAETNEIMQRDFIGALSTGITNMFRALEEEARRVAAERQRLEAEELAATTDRADDFAPVTDPGPRRSQERRRISGLEQEDAQALRSLLDELNPIEAAARAATEATDLLIRAFDAGAIDADTFADATLRVAGGFEKARSAIEDRGVIDGIRNGLNTLIEETEDVAGRVESALIGAFNSAEQALVSFVTTGKLDFSAFAQSVIQDLAQMAIRAAITGPLIQALGFGLGAGAAGGGTSIPGGVQLAHTGGVVGQTNFPQRIVDTSIFAGAQRFQGGGTILGRGEVPIIAHEGETIRTPEQERQLQSDRDITNNINVFNNTDANVDTDIRENETGGIDMDLRIDRAIARVLQRGDGPTARQLRRLGVGPAQTGR